MTDCLFCKIINGDIPADIVKESDHALAFRDINPQAPTHVLVIPKDHISSTNGLNETNMDALKHMGFLANEVALDEDIAHDGNRWIINTGDNGGQTVFHIHLHLLGGRQMLWPPG